MLARILSEYNGGIPSVLLCEAHGHIYLTPACQGTWKTPEPVKVAFVKIFCDMILPNPKMVLTLFGQSGVDNHVPWAHFKRPMMATDVSMRDRLICAGYFLKFHGNPAAPHM